MINCDETCVGNVSAEVPVRVLVFEEIVAERELEGVAYRYTPIIRDTEMMGITTMAISLFPFDNQVSCSTLTKGLGTILFLSIHTLFFSRERFRKP